MIILFIYKIQCDIDKILRRAETRDKAPTTVGDELLSAFKVASLTFDEENKIADKSPSAQNDHENKEWVFLTDNLLLIIV